MGASLGLFIVAVIVLVLMLFNGDKREHIRKEPGWYFDHVDSYDSGVDVYVNSISGEKLRVGNHL